MSSVEVGAVAMSSLMSGVVTSASGMDTGTPGSSSRGRKIEISVEEDVESEIVIVQERTLDDSSSASVSRRTRASELVDNALLNGESLPDEILLSRRFKGVYEITARSLSVSGNKESGKQKINGEGSEKKSKWLAKITTQAGVVIDIGIFDNKLDAAVAYDNMAVEIFGKSAVLNFNDNILKKGLKQNADSTEQEKKIKVETTLVQKGTKRLRKQEQEDDNFSKHSVASSLDENRLEKPQRTPKALAARQRTKKAAAATTPVSVVEEIPLKERQDFKTSIRSPPIGLRRVLSEYNAATPRTMLKSPRMSFHLPLSDDDGLVTNLKERDEETSQPNFIVGTWPRIGEEYQANVPEFDTNAAPPETQDDTTIIKIPSIDLPRRPSSSSNSSSSSNNSRKIRGGRDKISSSRTEHDDGILNGHGKNGESSPEFECSSQKSAPRTTFEELDSVSNRSDEEPKPAAGSSDQEQADAIMRNTILSKFRAIKGKLRFSDPDFGSLFPAEHFRPAPCTENWTTSEKTQYERAINRNLTDFRSVASEIRIPSRSGPQTKSVYQCVKHFYDVFRLSRAYATWKKIKLQKLLEEAGLVKDDDNTPLKKRRPASPTARDNSSVGETLGSDRSETGYDDFDRTGDDNGTKRKKTHSHKGQKREGAAVKYQYFPSRISEIRKESEEIRLNERWCVCGGSSLGFMIQCARCDTWFHAVCMGLRKDMISEDSEFRCHSCSIYTRKFGLQGPELERPAPWLIKPHRGELNSIMVVPMIIGLFGRVDVSRLPPTSAERSYLEKRRDRSGPLKVGELSYLKETPLRRDYTLLLCERRVPIWDHEKKTLIAGQDAPTVLELQAFLASHRRCMPFQGTIRQVPIISIETTTTEASSSSSLADVTNNDLANNPESSTRRAVINKHLSDLLSSPSLHFDEFLKCMLSDQENADEVKRMVDADPVTSALFAEQKKLVDSQIARLREKQDLETLSLRKKYENEKTRAPQESSSTDDEDLVLRFQTIQAEQEKEINEQILQAIYQAQILAILQAQKQSQENDLKKEVIDITNGDESLSREPPTRNGIKHEPRTRSDTNEMDTEKKQSSSPLKTSSGSRKAISPIIIPDQAVSDPMKISSLISKSEKQAAASTTSVFPPVGTIAEQEMLFYSMNAEQEADLQYQLGQLQAINYQLDHLRNQIEAMQTPSTESKTVNTSEQQQEHIRRLEEQALGFYNFSRYYERLVQNHPLVLFRKQQASAREKYEENRLLKPTDQEYQAKILEELNSTLQKLSQDYVAQLLHIGAARYAMYPWAYPPPPYSMIPPPIPVYGAPPPQQTSSSSSSSNTTNTSEKNGDMVPILGHHHPASRLKEQQKEQPIRQV